MCSQRTLSRTFAPVSTHEYLLVIAVAVSTHECCSQIGAATKPEIDAFMEEVCACECAHVSTLRRYSALQHGFVNVEGDGGEVL